MGSLPEDAADQAKDEHPSPLNLPAFLQHAGDQFQADYTLVVTIETIEYPTKKTTAPVSRAVMNADDSDNDDDDADDDQAPAKLKTSGEVNKVELVLMQDKQARVVEIIIHRCARIPRLLLKLIGICVPFHPTLERITLRWSPFDAVCLYEISKFLFARQSSLTEIFLDDSPVNGRNYYVLLNRHSNLRVLSLARCDLDDYDLIAITSLLAYPLPASKTLVILNLSMNNIGDSGACALGEMLRSNRMLQYINLAGNHVTSEGAICILKSLMEFPLTRNEITAKRLRQIKYIKQREKIYNTCLANIMTEKSLDLPDPTSKKRPLKGSKVNTSVVNRSGDTLHQRAHAMTAELIGYYCEPFSNYQTMNCDDRIYSFGNMVLSCLNLSYNNLDYACVPVLLNVLKHQNLIKCKEGVGLLRVHFAGNNVPVDCNEYEAINELIARAVSVRAAPPSKTPQVYSKISRRQTEKSSK